MFFDFAPVRTVAPASDVVTLAEAKAHVRYEDSDHHKLPFAHLHPRLYKRQGEKAEETW